VRERNVSLFYDSQWSVVVIKSERESERVLSIARATVYSSILIAVDKHGQQ
jgi:hypothetical protein